MTARWIIAAMMGAALMAAAPVSAQTVAFAASLTSGNEPAPPGNIPFFDNTHPFGSGTVTVDLAARTVKYSLSVFNLTGAVRSEIRVGAPGAAGAVVVNLAAPVPASVVLNNIADDVCYEIGAYAFDGIAAAAQFVLQPELGLRSADDVLRAIVDGKAYIRAGVAGKPESDIRGQLVPKK
jgi:hypothetical protein